MTLLSVVTIGVPAFFLALSPNPRRFTPGFLRRIVSRSVPLGAAIGLCVVCADRLSNDTTSTAATVAALLCFFVLLHRVAAPMKRWKLVLIVSMATVATLSLAVPPLREFLGFDPGSRVLVVSAFCALPAVTAVVTAFRLAR